MSPHIFKRKIKASNLWIIIGFILLSLLLAFILYMASIFNAECDTSYFHLSGTDFLDLLTAGIMTFHYDADGGLIEETIEDSYYKEVKRYDKHGNVVESLYYRHKKKGESDRYLGLKLESRRTRSYEYDEYGNWIRAVETYENADDLKHKRVQYTIYERKITYY